MITQFKKEKAKEEKNKVLWREIFDYYIENGSTKTTEKYAEIENIVCMRDIFDKYFHDEYEQYMNNLNLNIEYNKNHAEELKKELIAFGVDRQWDNYTNGGIVSLYNRVMRGKKRIDDTVEKINKIFDEFLEYGCAYVEKKYNDTNLRAKFIRYVPTRYKKYMHDVHGKEIDVCENIYENLIHAKCSNRKPRTMSENERNRRENMAIERKKVIDELLSFGATCCMDDSVPICTLKQRLVRMKIAIKKRADIVAMYESMYNEWIEHGFKEMCKKFDYTGTKGNLKKRFSATVAEPPPDGVVRRHRHL